MIGQLTMGKPCLHQIGVCHILPKVRAFVKTALKNVCHRDLTMSNNKKRGINIIIHVVVYFITPPLLFFCC